VQVTQHRQDIVAAADVHQIQRMYVAEGVAQERSQRPALGGEADDAAWGKLFYTLVERGSPGSGHQPGCGYVAEHLLEERCWEIADLEEGHLVYLPRFARRNSSTSYIMSSAAVWLLLLWFAWTSATFLWAIASKRLLSEDGLSPFEVTAAELTIGSCAVLAHAMASSWRKQPHSSSLQLVAAALASHPGCAWLLAALHAAGSWATLHAMGTLTVPLVQSMKASETLMTAAGCMALLGGAYSPNPLQALLLVGITVGLGVATGASLVWERWSVVAVALAGSLCVVLRNVLSKRFPLEGYALNAWLTVGGALLCMPVHLTTLRTTSLLGSEVQLVVYTGMLHFTYNALSCVVLARVTRPTTHSVMKAAQRLAVVVAAMVYFRQDTR
jgi:hypothetical protein